MNKLTYILSELNRLKPVVNIINNNVTSNFVADSLLAIGASPIMSSYKDDLKDVLKSVDSLVINCGTPDKSRFKSYKYALAKATDESLPIVLDYPGIGGSKFRNKIALKLTKYLRCNRSTTLIRGNYNEVYNLVSLLNKSIIDNKASIDSTKKNLITNLDVLYKSYSIVTATGKETSVHSRYSNTPFKVNGGSQFMSKVSGFGCVNSAISGAFLALEKYLDVESFELITEVQNLFFLAGSNAHNGSLGGFKSRFIEELYTLSSDSIKENIYDR